MEIKNSSLQDIEAIFQLFNSAIEYQKAKGYNLWPQFSRQLIETEIQERRHWKIVEESNILCIFSVLYSDPVIWEEKNNDPSVYLHRITTNPSFKGKGIIQIVKNWAVEHARHSQKKYVRMDTWGNNANLRNYYIGQGFTYLGQKRLNQPKDEIPHYGGSVLSLFEIEV